MTPPRTRDEILAVFCDLAEEDPTVLRDLLLRVARWERQPPAYWVAGPWRPAGDSWIREAVQIGRSVRMHARVDPGRAGVWMASARPSIVEAHESLGIFDSLEQARDAADSWCRERGWTLPEDLDPSAAPLPEDWSSSACTCTGPARDAHDPGCPVRLAHPRVDLGDPPWCTSLDGNPCAAWTFEGACKHVPRAHWRTT